MIRTIACVVGTRPEAIKMAPIVLASRAHPQLKLLLIATGQQDVLFNDALAAFGLSPDVYCGMNPAAQPSTLSAAILSWLKAHPPDLVLVQGDTNSALAGAQAARACGITIGHVEAGLRTHNPLRPFPEEQNRVAIAQLATLHFAPSLNAAENLRLENVCGRIFVTGNSGIDALMMQASCMQIPLTGQHILVTCHRRENFGTPLRNICSAIAQIASTSPMPIKIILHPNPHASAPIKAALETCSNIQLCEPLSYSKMINALRASYFVLTDSGGLQEECAALGIPLLCLREETERPELIDSGNMILVGNQTASIVKACQSLQNDQAQYGRMARPVFPYGQGNAAPQIVAKLGAYFDGSRSKNA